MPRVLVHEGGKVDDPQDPGGRTNQGVIQRVYDAYRKRKGLEPRDVYDMDAAERDEIYRLQYWNACHCDELPPGVDYAVFDGAVHSGPSQSIKWLQRALGTVTVDGQMGQATLNAVQEYGNPARLVDAMCDRRLAFLKALRTWPRFGGGWSKRVAGVRKVAKAWAIRTSVSVEPAEPTPKAPISHAKAMPTRAGADVATTSGVASGGIGGALETARSQLEPLADVIPAVGKIVAFLVIAGVVLMIGGMAYRWYANRQAVALADALDLPKGVAA